MGCTGLTLYHATNDAGDSISLHPPPFIPCTEFGYPDIFRVWETIWAARLSVSEHFEEFIALAVLQQYKLVHAQHNDVMMTSLLS